MSKIVFDKKEKENAFDRISKSFYERNFGQMSKSDIELMLFDIYIKKLISDNTNSDGTINYLKCSDYIISQDLGITQQKVRNLKIKNQLINPVKYDWKLALAKLTENARFDKTTNRIVLNIPDPNLYLEIENFLEEQGAYVEVQLNRKILQIRAEYYIDIIVSLEPEKNRKEIIKSLKSYFKKTGKDETVFADNEIGKSLIKGVVNVTDVAANLSSIVSPDNSLAKSLINLLTQ